MQQISVLSLYFATLLNWLMRSSRFLVSSSEFPVYSIMSSTHSDSFTFIFPVWIFYYFSSLIYVTRTCKIMFNKSNESGYPCLVPDLRGNASSFSPLNMMLDMSLPYQAFSVLSYVPSMSTFWSFIIMDVEFYQKFFLYLLRWSCGFHSSLG